MGTLAKCGTSVIVAVNSFFGLIGLIFLVGGIFVRFMPDMIDKLSQKAMDKIAEQIPDEAGIDLTDLKLSDLVGDAGTPLIAVGAVLLVVVGWAYCGTCLKSRWMLVVYAAILTVVILGEIIAVVMITTNRSTIDNAIKKPLKKSVTKVFDGEKIDKAIKKPLKKSVTKFYTGETGKDLLTLGWNALMGLLHCCGVDGPDDFTPTTLWNHTYTHPGPTEDTVVQITVVAPLLCCQNKTAKCSTMGESGHKYNKGCYDAIWEMIKKQTKMAIGIASGVGAIQVLLWIFVVAVIKDLGQNNKVGPK